MRTKRFLIEVPDTAYEQEFWREGGPAVQCGMTEVTAESIRLQLLAGAGVAEVDKAIEPQKERLATIVCISFDSQTSVTVTELQPDSDCDCAKARRLHNTLGHGNGLDSESMSLLRTHMENCTTCGSRLTSIEQMEKLFG